MFTSDLTRKYNNSAVNQVIQFGKNHMNCIECLFQKKRNCNHCLCTKGTKTIYSTTLSFHIGVSIMTLFEYQKQDTETCRRVCDVHNLISISVGHFLLINITWHVEISTLLHCCRVYSTILILNTHWV